MINDIEIIYATVTVTACLGAQALKIKRLSLGAAA